MSIDKLEQWKAVVEAIGKMECVYIGSIVGSDDHASEFASAISNIRA